MVRSSTLRSLGRLTSICSPSTLRREGLFGFPVSRKREWPLLLYSFILIIFINFLKFKVSNVTDIWQFL